MALKSTVYKAELQISDLTRHYYETHVITIALHPSETVERMMVRLAAYAWNASEQLSFTKGLSEVSEPDIWLKNYSDEIELWIDIGQPDDDRIRRASAKADRVEVYDFHSSNNVWWQNIQNKLTRFDNVTVWQINSEMSEELALLAERNMRLQITIDHNDMWLSSDTRSVQVTRIPLMGGN